jgi:signal transduction histidine kinase
LLAAAGVAWFAANLWPPALYLHRGPLVHALLGHPNGRTPRPLARLAVAAAYIDGSVRALGDEPIATFALCLLVACAAVDGWLATPRLRRRAQRNATALTLLFCLVLAAEGLGRMIGWDAEDPLLHGYELTLTLVAVVLTADLLRRRWSELAGLVVDLGAADAPLTLRDELARVLGDPSLAVGYRLGDKERFVDEAGRPFLLPGPSSDRAVTSVEDRGERIAVIVHDPAGPDDLALLSALASVARIAVVNARLQAEARARVSALAASRRRVIDAATTERRRLGAELHEGAERRLHAVAAELEQLDDGESDGMPLLDEVGLQLEAARSELRRLAAGLVPLEGSPAARPSPWTSGWVPDGYRRMWRRAPTSCAPRR